MRWGHSEKCVCRDSHQMTAVLIIKIVDLQQLSHPGFINLGGQQLCVVRI